MTSANQLALELGERIVQYCIANDLQPRARLTERKLAHELGVSRSPIRSALKVLADRKVLERASAGYVLACDRESLTRFSLNVPPAAADELYYQVLHDRFAGKLPEHVSEADLMREYGVTRSTLNKSLMKLNKDGYISRSAGRGWTFHETLGTIEAYTASYEFRLAIEPAALGSPNYRIDRTRVQRLLERHLELLDGASGKVDGTEWFALDAELHEMLVGFSGNEFFLRAIRAQNQLRRIVEIQSFYADERVRASFDEHVGILNALLNDDPRWAATLLTRHLQLASESTEVFFARAGKENEETVLESILSPK